MGLLKKIFKPVSKVLDKIVPNEIKPFLPYAAAFAPMMLGPASFMGSGIMQRALLSGGMNVAGQLAQEGNEGDINLLSAGLGALSGAMTAPGFKSSLEGFRPDNVRFDDYTAVGSELAPSSFLDKARNVGIDYLQKGSDFMQAPGLKKYGIPAAQGSLDNMFAQAKRDQDAYDDMMSEDSGGGYTDDAYRAAIRKSMEAYGASEEEILSAIEAAGYKTGGRVGFSSGDYVGSSDNETMKDEYDSYIKEIEIDGDSPMSFLKFKKMIESDYAKGGRVGLRFGGIGAAVNQIENQDMQEAAQFASMLGEMDIPIADLSEEFEIQFKRKPNSLEELKQFYKDRYEYKGPGDVKMKEEIKEKVVMGAKDGGLMNLGGKEMDLRGGGFVPIGKKERADDVPARLSKNEFVMTADAVRAAGGGSVNKGAKRMYETMNKLEARA